MAETPDPLAMLAAEEDAGNQQVEEPVQEEPAAAAEAPEAEAVEETPAWQQRGFKDPEAMWDAYRSLESRFRERDDEVGQLRAFRSQAEPLLNQMAQQQQQPQQGADPVYYTPEQLERWVDEGQITVGQMADTLAAQRTQGIMEMAEARIQELEQRFAPTLKEVDQLASKNSLDTLIGQVGEDLVRKHADRLAEVLEADEGRFTDRTTRVKRMRDVIQSAEWEQMQQGGGGQPAAEAADGVAVTRGSSAAPQTRPAKPLSEEEQEIEALRSFKRPVDEEGIPLPW